MTNGIFDTERRTMSIYGYCRISTAKQSIDRQIRNIKAEYPTAHIVQEAYTGTSILRPEWEQAVSDPERGRYCGVRFRLPNVQKCRRGIFTI